MHTITAADDAAGAESFRDTSRKMGATEDKMQQKTTERLGERTTNSGRLLQIVNV